MTSRTTEASIAKLSGYQRSVLTLLAVLQFLVILDFMILSPLGYLLTTDLQITTSQFGLVVSAYIFSAAASGIVVAGFVDRYDRKKVLLFFFGGFIVGTFFCALSDSFLMLLISRVVTGIFGGVVGSVTMTIVSDLFAPGQRGRAVSTVQLAFAASQVLGVPLGLVIAESLDWHYTFFLIVVVSLFLFAAVVLWLRPVTDHLARSAGNNPWEHLFRTFINQRHRVGFAATIVLGLSTMVQPFVSIFLVDNIHVPATRVPVVFMVTGASAFVVMPLVSRLSDRFDKFRIFLIGSLATIVLVPLYTQLPVVPLWVVLIFSVLMFAAMMSRMGPFQALNSMIPLAEFRGAYMSVSMSLQQMAGGMGIVIAGMIAYQPTPGAPLLNFEWVGYLAAVLAAGGVYLVYRVRLLIK